MTIKKPMDIIIKSCCLYFSHPALSKMGYPDYAQIIIKEWDDKEHIIFQGSKWNEEDFKKKKKSR